MNYNGKLNAQRLTEMKQSTPGTPAMRQTVSPVTQPRTVTPAQNITVKKLPTNLPMAKPMLQKLPMMPMKPMR